MAFTGKTALSAAHIHYSLIKMVLCLLLLLLEKHFAFAGRRQAGSWPFTDLWDACGPRVTQVLPPVLPLQHLRQPDLHYGSGWRFPSVLDCIRPSALSKKNQNQSINHAGADAEHQHRPGHHEQLGRRSGDESLALNSSAGETIAFAKPVMGTSVPAPARLATLSNSPRPVSSAAARTSVTETAVPACSCSNPRLWYHSISPCPTTQIPNPPRKRPTPGPSTEERASPCCAPVRHTPDYSDPFPVPPFPPQAE